MPSPDEGRALKKTVLWTVLAKEPGGALASNQKKAYSSK